MCANEKHNIHFNKIINKESEWREKEKEKNGKKVSKKKTHEVEREFFYAFCHLFGILFSTFIHWIARIEAYHTNPNFTPGLVTNARFNVANKNAAKIESSK